MSTKALTVLTTLAQDLRETRSGNIDLSTHNYNDLMAAILLAISELRGGPKPLSLEEAKQLARLACFLPQHDGHTSSERRRANVRNRLASKVRDLLGSSTSNYSMEERQAHIDRNVARLKELLDD